LRGLLSCWVVASHMLLASGFRYEALPRLIRILVQGGYAVDVFIILSGFVITKLVAEKREAYRVFILRRFLRLFPVFAVTMLVAILLRPLIWSILASGWSPDLAALEYDRARWDSETHYFWVHILAHLPMLHGAIPETLLPYSGVGFLPPAWSISLEWQYYLVAPFLAYVGRRFGPGGWFILVIGSILTSFQTAPIMDHLFPMQSFLPQKLLLFLIGGSCYWIFVEVGGVHRDLAWRLFFFVAPVVLWVTLSIPLAIWTAVFALILGNAENPGISRFKAFLNLPGIQRLGAISYSTYLVHLCCIWLVQACLLRMAPQINRVGMLIGLLILAAPLSFAASEILHRFIERPGIRLGWRLIHQRSR
jgi:peptidoglycan/LPS O-acetylase OafA/YrhL